MTSSEFSISVSEEAVEVVYTPSLRDPRSKLFGFVFDISLLVVFACALLFLPGRGAQLSLWDHLTTSAPASGKLVTLLGFVLFLGLMTWQTSRYTRAAWASDETFHCDRQAITISRVPWLDFSNHTWRTYRYPLSEVRAVRFAVIASAKGRGFWGLRFRAHGRRWCLPGLEAPEAKVILDGLRALGADVPEDPNLEKRINQTLEMKFGYTGWMDRSWMDKDKQ